MRMLPFFKPKKGFMVAGGGLETSTGGGGGGGGGGGECVTLILQANGGTATIPRDKTQAYFIVGSNGSFKMLTYVKPNTNDFENIESWYDAGITLTDDTIIIENRNTNVASVLVVHS